MQQEINKKQEEKWDAYFKETYKRPPSDVAVTALEYCKENEGLVVDLGCGSGTDTFFFLAQGWHVLAIDLQVEFIENRKSMLAQNVRERLEIVRMHFEELELPSGVNCVIANYSLPFCLPQSFASMWERIVNSLEGNGIFSGIFFGNRDGWTNEMGTELTFFTKEQVYELFQTFYILEFQESEYEGFCCGKNGERIPKHWHIFRVVARKRKEDLTNIDSR
ncbi:class I SAM-dependent methyltransferase [Anaerosporobacter faecicola]|uniref:class I SAM-dependent methyltransferase n=1 Tax=Anaerosporobacter faecicola TaxID=2718714 RepID=UPI00143A304B|nr:class I SAM-dependent methyltransferase [Anaerosporobacter faecicola]